MKSVVLMAVVVSGCSYLQPKPQIITKTDTVTVVKEVPAPPPPLAAGDSVDICLSTGMTAIVHITAARDTLIGDARIPISAVRPSLSFAGAYAQQWPDTVRFEKRLYRKHGVVKRKTCDELKNVGELMGIPVFAEVTAPQPLPMIIIPMRPGGFQDYVLPTPARRR
jgi:hypothetical protein